MADHQHSPIGKKCTPVGEHVCLMPTVHGDDEHLAGFFFCHDVAGDDGGMTMKGQRCIGGVNVDPHFDGERPRWEITGSLEAGDLTLSPSIRCINHDTGPSAITNAHGFVRDGKWVQT